MPYSAVRASKYRHVFGKNLKKDECYEDIRISKSSWDSTFSAVNGKFLAIIVEGGAGSFLVWSLDGTGRIKPDAPKVEGHKMQVQDIAWCPHNENVIASASEDCHVKVWQIPDGGLTGAMSEPIVDLVQHTRGVRMISWHPSAQNVLMSGGSDCQVIIWNVGTGEALNVFSLPEIMYHGGWNWNGSEVLFTCKDKKLRICDPRKGEVKEEGTPHDGMKPTQAVFTKNGLIFTTGFTKQSERQYSLRKRGKLDDPLCIENIDVSNGVMFPMYDPDTDLVYLCGKGDNVIRYFEISDEAPYVHYVNTYQGDQGQRGIAMGPKTSCDVSINETAKFYRTNNKGFCQVISFTVPRKSEIFQADLYPDTQSGAPALTADEWWSGKDKDPILMQVTEEMGKGGKKQSEELVVERAKPNILNQSQVGRVSARASAGAGATADQMSKMEKKVAEMEIEMTKLKAKVAEYETRIKKLEGK